MCHSYLNRPDTLHVLQAKPLWYLGSVLGLSAPSGNVKVAAASSAGWKTSPLQIHCATNILGEVICYLPKQIVAVAVRCTERVNKGSGCASRVILHSSRAWIVLPTQADPGRQPAGRNCRWTSTNVGKTSNTLSAFIICTRLSETPVLPHQSITSSMRALR